MKKPSFIAKLLSLSLLILSSATVNGSGKEKFDLLIINGSVMDGTGNPAVQADIGIRDGKIVAVGNLEQKSAAKKIINAEGLIVAPGFIDIHCHAYDPVSGPDSWKGKDEKRFFAPNFVSQGITTLVCNQCGHGPLSIAKQKKRLAEHRIGPNAMLMIGHNRIRFQVMGNDYKRKATKEEIEKMCLYIRKAMEDGAAGLSTGLEYEPAIWSDTEELIALVKEIVPFGGVYMPHERASGKDPMWYLPSMDMPAQPTILDHIAETIEIAERTGVRAVLTHLKFKGTLFWGCSGAAVNMVNRARSRGVDIWADCYVYNTTGTDGNTVLIPHWALGGGGPQWAPINNPLKGLKNTLNDPDKVKKMRMDIKHEIERRGGAENIVVMDYPDTSLIGRTIAEIARENNISSVDVAIKLQLEGYKNRAGGARLRGYSLSETDIDVIIKQPWTATCTDASISLMTDGPVHARFYGGFPRKIKRFVLDRHIISLEHAIRSMTSLPAQILGLRHRGMIREGFYADIVIFDLKRIRDAATQFNPHQYAQGIEYVFVNGTAVVEGGELTWKLPGVVISHHKK